MMMIIIVTTSVGDEVESGANFPFSISHFLGVNAVCISMFICVRPG